VENRFTLDDAKAADEAFISGASTYVLPVVKIDDQEISAGTPGELSRRLREIYISYARASLV
jgi:D-alanine transaminase